MSKAIITKYLSFTNTKPSRIKASAEGVVPQTYTCNALDDFRIKNGLEHITNHQAAARLFAQRNSWSTDLASGGLPGGDWVHCFVPNTVSSQGKQTRLPLTDPEKAEAYRDWFNNYTTLAHFARCKGLTEAQAKVLIAEGKVAHEASVKPTEETTKVSDSERIAIQNALCGHTDFVTLPKPFTVITISINSNSFGYKSVLALAEDGEGVELLVQAYGTDKVPVRGEVVHKGESRWYGQGRTLPKITPARAKSVLKGLREELADKQADNAAFGPHGQG